MILFNDFQGQYRAIQTEIQGAVNRVLESGWYILGRELEAFEAAFAAYNGSRYCVGVASGTEAIELALIAAGTRPDDEVITTSMTAYPTICAILSAGARPVVVDIDSVSGLMDPEKIEAKISARTRAIVPVHLYGQSCDMARLKALAETHSIKLIEDCAQSAGAAFGEKKTGTIGDAGCFSFYPTKNLGAYGDAGAIITDDEQIFEQLKYLRNYGQTKRYYHDQFGINSRLDEIQAAILLVKLQYLDEWNAARQKIAAFYKKRLGADFFLEEKDYGTPVYHLLAACHTRRDALMARLNEKGIQTLIHYPVPVHQQKAYTVQKDESLPAVEKFAAQIFSLPIYPGLPEKNIDFICDAIREFN